MDTADYKQEVMNGSISLVVSLIVTYMVSLVYPTSEIVWALIAVGFASFFSGFFSSYYA